METDGVSEELPGWEGVQIKDDFYGESSVTATAAAFPPGDHEDLPINTPQDSDDQPSIESELVDTPLPSVGDRDEGLRKWLKRLHFGDGILGNLANRFRKSVGYNRVGWWSVAWTAGGVAAVLLIWYLRTRILVWQQRRYKNLMVLVREKDKKINELLAQIAQTNEALLARRRVPVIRVK